MTFLSWDEIVRLARSIEQTYAITRTVDPCEIRRLARAILWFQARMVGRAFEVVTARDDPGW